MSITSMITTLDKDKSYLIKALQMAQDSEGYISDATITEVALHFAISPVEVEGVVSFYAQFKRSKPGKYIIAVCDGTACHIKGANLITGWLSDELGIKDGETDTAGVFSLNTVACLGCCSLAPVISVNGRVHGNLDRRGLLKVLKQYKREAQV